jgi:hypothetical protein
MTGTFCIFTAPKNEIVLKLNSFVLQQSLLYKTSAIATVALFAAKTLIITTFSITTLSITKLSIMGFFMTQLKLQSA